ncbi:hypothetical protein HID58_053313, partial [Brassica napus]
IPEKEIEPTVDKEAIVEECQEDAIVEECHAEAEGGEVGRDDEGEDATSGGEASESDEQSIDSEAGLSEKSESDDDVEIPDEDEEYPATDDSSGDEEEQAERLVKRNVPDGVFSLRQLFNTGEEFKENVLRYILKTRRNVVFDRWEKTKLGVADQSPVIADLFLEDIRRDPEMSAPEIKDEMKRRYNIIISPPQSQVARIMIFDKLQAETNEQFARLRDYEAEIKRLAEKEEKDIVVYVVKRDITQGGVHSQEDRAKSSRLNEEAQLEGQVQAQLQAQEEANEEAQEDTEMEADLMAQIGGGQAHEEAEVQDDSSTTPQLTQVLRRSSRLASLLFG